MHTEESVLHQAKHKRSLAMPDPGGHRPQCPWARAKRDQAQAHAPGQKPNHDGSAGTECALETMQTHLVLQYVELGLAI